MVQGEHLQFAGDFCFIGKYCGAGAELNDGVVTQSRTAYAKFRTDRSLGYDGFRLYYQAVQGKADETYTSL